MRAWVFARRGNARAADRFAENLVTGGGFDTAARADSRWYEGELYTDADVIYHDGSTPLLQHVHEREGITCEYVDFGYTQEPEHPEPEVAKPVHTVEYKAPWFTIYGPDGEKVGKATKSEQEANERLQKLNEGVGDGG